MEFTSFNEIYEMSSLIGGDDVFCNTTKDDFFALMNRYLDFAIAEFQDDCVKNLDDITPFQKKNWCFVGDGKDNVIVLDDVISNSEICVYYRKNDEEAYKELLDYTYNEDTSTILFTETPQENSQIYVACYIVGGFNFRLTKKEKEILSFGMKVPYLAEKIMKDTLLSQMVYSGNMKMYSQANHISALNDVYDTVVFKTLKSMINSYSFKNSMDDMMGLAGGD